MRVGAAASQEVYSCVSNNLASDATTATAPSPSADRSRARGSCASPRARRLDASRGGLGSSVGRARAPRSARRASRPAGASSSAARFVARRAFRDASRRDGRRRGVGRAVRVRREPRTSASDAASVASGLARLLGPALASSARATEVPGWVDRRRADGTPKPRKKRDAGKRNRGFAVLEFPDAALGRDAAAALHGATLDGRALRSSAGVRVRRSDAEDANRADDEDRDRGAPGEEEAAREARPRDASTIGDKRDDASAATTPPSRRRWTNSYSRTPRASERARTRTRTRTASSRGGGVASSRGGSLRRSRRNVVGLG